MSIKIASMNFGDCDTILHNTPNGMKNITEVLGPNGEVYWTSTKELTGVPPLSIKSNGTLLLDYLISGNMTQTGTPTPDSPIQPSECGERTRNLFDKDNVDITHIYPLLNGTTFTQGGDNSWSIIMPCKPNTTYTLSKSILSHSNPRHRVSGSEEYPTAGGAQTFIDDKSETISGDTRSRQIFTTTENTHWIVCFLYSNNIYEKLIEQLQSLQLEEANDKTEYEPYGYKLPISSAGQTNNIYLGEVPTTRKIKKVVFNGTEPWVLSGTVIYINNTDTEKLSPLVCTHFPNVTNTGMWNGNYWIFQVDISRLGMSGREAWITYLAQQYANGTPVTVWYVLAEPETGIVNEPIRKIGNYADTVSMEQAGVQIPILHGNTVIDVDTTLKPSQMYIKYK